MVDPNYAVVAALIAIAVCIGAAMLGLSHIIGTRRSGPVKDTPYESGMPVIGDARRRFNVKFYLVAMLFLLFDVEVVFIWPWAVTFYRSATDPESAVNLQMQAAGFSDPAKFFLVAGALFFALLLVGYFYDLWKGIFKWS
jgi:NADH-quinone oxidoreductase subunit A